MPWPMILLANSVAILNLNTRLARLEANASLLSTLSAGRSTVIPTDTIWRRHNLILAGKTTTFHFHSELFYMMIGHQLVLFIAVNGCQSFHLTTSLTRSLSSSSSSLDRHVLVLPPLSRTRDDRLLLHRRRGIEFGVPSLRVSSLNEDGYLTNENDEELSYAVVRPTPSLIDAPTNPADDFSFVAKKFKSFLLSMSAFLLPLFMLFSLSNPAWAVQSGGRMGGSFGGGGASQSSSRSYRSSSPSSYGGNSRGYTSGGYGYSRPSTNVIISPGINPFYR